MYKIIGGKKELINAIYEGMDIIISISDKKNTITWESGEGVSNFSNRKSFKWSNLHNYSSKKEVQEKAISQIMRIVENTLELV